MLSSHYYAVNSQDNAERPTLVFLHGLLGSGADWLSVVERLDEYPRLTIDLPGHGHSLNSVCTNFDDCCEQISRVIHSQLPEYTDIVLVGYSLGARIVMYGLATGAWSSLSVKAAILEGGNFGLQSTEEKCARFDNDRRWATRFEEEAIERVLADWYQQRVFASLTESQRRALVLKRSENVGMHVAKMLMATSLSVQPWLLDALKRQTVPVLYVCGERDEKFQQLAANSGLLVNSVRQAGHNAHVEQPEQYAQLINHFLFCS